MRLPAAGRPLPPGGTLPAISASRRARRARSSCRWPELHVAAHVERFAGASVPTPHVAGGVTAILSPFDHKPRRAAAGVPRPSARRCRRQVDEVRRCRGWRTRSRAPAPPLCTSRPSTCSVRLMVTRADADVAAHHRDVARSSRALADPALRIAARSPGRCRSAGTGARGGSSRSLSTISGASWLPYCTRRGRRRRRRRPASTCRRRARCPAAPAPARTSSLASGSACRCRRCRRCR